MLVAPQKTKYVILIEIYNKVPKTVWQTLKPKLLAEIGDSEKLIYQRDDCYFLDNFGNELDRATVDSLEGADRFRRVSVMSVDWANSEDARLNVKWERTKLKIIWLDTLSETRAVESSATIQEELDAVNAQYKLSHFQKNLETGEETFIRDDWEQKD